MAMQDSEKKRLDVQSDYAAGYLAARAVDPDTADRYVAHTAIGDPLADTMIEDLLGFSQAEIHSYLQAGIDGDARRLRDAPAAVHEFFAEAAKPPSWLDPGAFRQGVRMFHRHADMILMAMVGGTLVEGFSSNIAKSFFITGRLRDQGVRRLQQNNRHMLEIFLPNGMERYGDGWKLSVRIRWVHAQARTLLKDSPDWDYDAWGCPLSSAHLGLAISAFSARLLQYLTKLGVRYNEEERDSFMAVWRYSGHLMGIPDSILFRDEAEALKLFEIAHLCEPPPDLESVVMAHALMNSAPLILGIEHPPDRRAMAAYAFRISRALIGNELADELRYPATSTLGVLAWFRLRIRYSNAIKRIFPGLASGKDFLRFENLMNASAYDESGISLRFPNHVYSEESTRW